MSYTVYAKMKKLGRQKKETLEPVPFVLKTQPKTLRELLTALVELLVEDYNARGEENQMLGCLTKEEIDAKAKSGKVSFGLRGGNAAETEPAIANAIQCFEDGIYRVFAGEEELTELDGEIPWEENLVFTFIRLAMLSGW